MARLADIRAEIARSIKNAFPESVCTGYALESPTTPAFEVEFGGKVYDQTMSRGLDTYTFIIRGLSSSAVLDEAAQRTLDKYLESTGSNSVKAALETDRTLGRTVSDAHVTRIGPIREFSPIASPGTKYYGAEWTLIAVVPGD